MTNNLLCADNSGELKNMNNTTSIIDDIKITDNNGQLTVSSLQVAKDFDKEHRNVIQMKKK